MLKLNKPWIACSLFGLMIATACNENKTATKKRDNGADQSSPQGTDSTRNSELDSKSNGGKELGFGLDLPPDYVAEQDKDASDSVADDDGPDDMKPMDKSIPSDGNEIQIRCKVPSKKWYGYMDVRLDNVSSGSSAGSDVASPEQPSPETTAVSTSADASNSSAGSVSDGLGLAGLADKPDSNWGAANKHRQPLNCHQGLQILLRKLSDGDYRLTADVFGMKKRHSFTGETDVFTVRNGSVASAVVLHMKRVPVEEEGKVAVQVEWDDAKKPDPRGKLCGGFYNNYKKDWNESQGMPVDKIKGLSGRCLSIIRVHSSEVGSDKEVFPQLRAFMTSKGLMPQKWEQDKKESSVRNFYLVPGVYAINGFAAGYYPAALTNLVLRPGEVLDVKMVFKPKEQAAKSVSDEVGSTVKKCHDAGKPYNYATKTCFEDGSKLIPLCTDATFQKFVESMLKPALDKAVADKFDAMWKDKVENVMKAGGFSAISQCFMQKDPSRLVINYVTPDNLSVKSVYIQMDKSPI